VAWIKNKRAGAMIIFIILMLAVIFWIQDIKAGLFDESSPSAVHGVQDLSDWSFADNGIAKLDGEWEFYWERLHTPESFAQLIPPEPTGMVQVPGTWKLQGAERENPYSTGFATYRLKLKLPSNDQLLAIGMPPITSSYRLWINGEELAQSGTVSTSEANAVPRYATGVVAFRTNTSTVEILIQVSNYHHIKGGIRQSVEIGLLEEIVSREEVSLGFDTLLFGSLLIMGLYHLGLFAFRNKDLSMLYFGIFSLMIALRTILIGEIALLKVFPSFPWELELKLEYISAYCGLSLFILFIGRLYPEESDGSFQRIFLAISACFTLFTIVVPALVFTRFLISFHAITLCGILSVLYVLPRAWQRQREGSSLILAASIIFALTIVNDMMYANEWISTTGRASGLGLLVFVMSQSVVLSMKLSRAFSNEEKMSAALAQMNSGLNVKIKERTADLELANNTLMVKNDELSRLEISRSHLLSNISHDLGTPLTTIRCYAEAILDGMVDSEEQQKQYVRLIHGKVLGMSRLIEDLFQLSQLEARQVAFQMQTVTTDRLIQLLFSRYELDTRNAGISYELTLSGHAADSRSFSNVNVDVERLHQVFSNLLYNAIKFTLRGGSIKVEMVDDGRRDMLCRISDTGVGIGPVDLPFIFDRFYTSNKSRNSVIGGKGLGLSISKEIVESHGGKIWVERSTLNVGTVFCFTVPIQTS
jgi:signal transduction histidine kinase